MLTFPSVYTEHSMRVSYANRLIVALLSRLACSLVGLLGSIIALNWIDGRRVADNVSSRSAGACSNDSQFTQQLCQANGDSGFDAIAQFARFR